MPDSEKDTIFPSKKCPECYTYIPLDVRKCPSCKIRVGKIDKNGLATRPTNWKANIICLVAWLVFAVFVKYAFFND